MINSSKVSGGKMIVSGMPGLVVTKPRSGEVPMLNTEISNQNYMLGHSDKELARLSEQARIVGPITRRFFLEAGLVPGMRVLNIGSGAGDVSFLVADLVGDNGTVVGVNRSSVAVVAATTRATATGRHNVSFREDDPAEMTFDEPFGYIPRDAAEQLVGPDLGRTTFFRCDETAKLRTHPEWRDTEPSWSPLGFSSN
jgi:hypothetical protein